MLFDIFNKKKRQLKAVCEDMSEYIIKSSLILAGQITGNLKANYTEDELIEFFVKEVKEESKKQTYSLYSLQSEIAFEATALSVHILDRMYLPKIDKKDADYVYQQLTNNLLDYYTKRFMPVYEADEVQIRHMLMNNINDKADQYSNAIKVIKDTAEAIFNYCEILAVQIKKLEQKNLTTYGTKDEVAKFDEIWREDFTRVQRHASRAQVDVMKYFTNSINLINF
jgi:hypothetical protein